MIGHWIIFTTVCILTIAAAVDKCGANDHSTRWREVSPPRVSLFLADTYSYGGNKCDTVTNPTYREMLKRAGYDLGSMEVEHIIDIAHSELPGCNKNIRGNLVIADASWNRGVGNLCWTYASAEKANVYGEIFTNARTAVRECCLNAAAEQPSLEEQKIIHAETIGDVALALACISFVLLMTILGTVALMFYKKYRAAVPLDMNEGRVDEDKIKLNPFTVA